jgi:hypothetical protein
MQLLPWRLHTRSSFFHQASLAVAGRAFDGRAVAGDREKIFEASVRRCSLAPQPEGEEKGGAEMMRVIEAAAPEVYPHSAAKPASIEAYLHALARACLEGATNPRVRGLLFALLLRAPSTLAQLGRERRRIAA